MPAARYRVFVDWDNTGSFTEVRDEVTKRILDNRKTVSITYGRDQIRAGSPTAVGQAGFGLNNLSRDYSPENTSSPLAGKVFPGRPVLIQGTFASVDYVLYRGYLDDFSVFPGKGNEWIDVSCVDPLGRVQGLEVSTGLYRSIRTGEAINVILDEAGWPTIARDIDPGATVIPYWWLNKVDAYQAMQDLVDSEGGPALITADGQGRVVFRDRHHRLTLTASTTVQSTWRSAGAVEPLVSEPSTYNHGWKEIVNSVDFEVVQRRASSDFVQVWSSDERISLGPGETTTITASASAPFFDAITPVAGVDYTATAGSVQVTLTRTSGEAVGVTLTAIGAEAVIDNLQIRARTVVTAASTQVRVEDPVSIERYGRRAAPSERAPTWANAYDALAIGQILIGRRADRLATINVTLSGGVSSRLVQQLSRNLSDRVHLVQTSAGVDADCFIESIEHSIGQGGLEHRTSFGLEQAPALVANPLTFDQAGSGFGQGRFQVMGVDSPTTMFRFDTAGQGFGQGMFSY